MRHLAIRVLCAPAWILAAIGTPAAWMFCAGGILAGLHGAAEREPMLGALLSACSLLALIGVFTLWSITGRLWRTGLATEVTRRDRYGLLSGWAALTGLLVLAPYVHREAEIFLFSFLLGPAWLVVSVAALWIQAVAGDSTRSAPSMREQVTFIANALRLNLSDAPGVIVGMAIGVLGVAYLVPRGSAHPGTPCTLAGLYPPPESLWVSTPAQVWLDFCGDLFEMVAACLTGAGVCLLAGACAALLGKAVSAARAAWSAALVVASVLIYLVLEVSAMHAGIRELPTYNPAIEGPRIGWSSTLVIAVAAVAGGALVGLRGGRLAESWRPAARAVRN